MDNTSQITNFYLSSSIILDEEFGVESLDHYDEADLIYPSFYDAFQAYAQRHH